MAVKKVTTTIAITFFSVATKKATIVVAITFFFGSIVVKKARVASYYRLLHFFLLQ
jgi:hypothetical protein